MSHSISWEVLHSSFFGGWVVKKTIVNCDGPYQGTYVDFPDCTYGVLDSQTVHPHKTRQSAERAMSRLRKHHERRQKSNTRRTIASPDVAYDLREVATAIEATIGG